MNGKRAREENKVGEKFYFPDSRFSSLHKKMTNMSELCKRSFSIHYAYCSDFFLFIFSLSLSTQHSSTELLFTCLILFEFLWWHISHSFIYFSHFVSICVNFLRKLLLSYLFQIDSWRAGDENESCLKSLCCFFCYICKTMPHI